MLLFSDSLKVCMDLSALYKHKEKGMQKFKTSKLLRLSVVTLILSLILSLSVGCTAEKEMASKEDIANSISSVTDRDVGYEYVHLYLRDMGISNFSIAKMLWVEVRFQAYFNLESGLPSTREHARLTADLFTSEYYDKIDVKNTEEVTNALITCYVDVIGDRYSVYRTPIEQTEYGDDMSGEFGGVGVVIEYDHDKQTLTVSSVYIDSPAEDAGILPGDLIVGVDGVSVDEIGYLNAVYHVRGRVGTSVTLTVQRGDALFDFTMTRAKIAETTVGYEMLENNIGIIQIIGFKANTFEQFVEAIDHLEENGAEGIIFDLRGNPGGFVDTVCNMLSYVLPNDKPLVSYQYKGYPLTTIQSETDVHPTKKDLNDPSKPLQEDHYVKVPMVVICDELTASSGEIFTAAIRDHAESGLIKATLVGQNTFGKGIIQTSWTYYDGSSITVTVAYYDPPCGKNYHGTGISPDRTVSNEIVDDTLIDRQLEAAVEEMHILLNQN